MPTDDPIFDGFTITGQPRAVFTSSGATGRGRGPVRRLGAPALARPPPRRRLPPHGRREQAPLIGGVEQAGHRVHRRHAVPPPPQRLDDLRRAREGHGALGRRAAREHRDPHQRIPASWCSTSYRVTIPAILPSRRTSAAGVSRDSSVVSRSTGRSASTTRYGASITSCTGRSRVAGSSSARAISTGSATAPTPSPPSSTGSCDTLYVLMRFSAWRTVAVGGTEINGGAPEFRASSSCTTDTRAASRI